MAIEDLNSKAPVEADQMTAKDAAVGLPADAPELDGSIDALVANLRAARNQFAELLERAETKEPASQSKVA